MTTACTNNNDAFRQHGIEDGISLIHSTRYQLLNQGLNTFESTPEFFERLSRTFRTAFIRTARIPLGPEPLDVAIDDATVLITRELEDQPDPDLRYSVLPKFYRAVAKLYCAYRDEYLNDIGIWYDDGDEGGIRATP